MIFSENLFKNSAHKAASWAYPFQEMVYAMGTFKMRNYASRGQLADKDEEQEEGEEEDEDEESSVR